VTLRVDDEDDQNEHDEAELRQANACEHECLPWGGRTREHALLVVVRFDHLMEPG
jgi:hypothetical protein